MAVPRELRPPSEKVRLAERFPPPARGRVVEMVSVVLTIVPGSSAATIREEANLVPSPRRYWPEGAVLLMRRPEPDSIFMSPATCRRCSGVSVPMPVIFPAPVERCTSPDTTRAEIRTG